MTRRSSRMTLNVYARRDDGAKAREIHRDALTLRIIRVRSLLYRIYADVNAIERGKITRVKIRQAPSARA